MSADEVVSAAVAAGADNAVVVAIASVFDRQPPVSPACTDCTKCKEWQDSVATLSANLLSGIEVQLSNCQSSPDRTKGSVNRKMQEHKTSIEAATLAFAGASGHLSPAILHKTVTNSLQRVATLAAAHEALLGCGKCERHKQLSESVRLLDEVIKIINPHE